MSVILYDENNNILLPLKLLISSALLVFTRLHVKEHLLYGRQPSIILNFNSQTSTKYFEIILNKKKNMLFIFMDEKI